MLLAKRSEGLHNPIARGFGHLAHRRIGRDIGQQRLGGKKVGAHFSLQRRHFAWALDPVAQFIKIGIEEDKDRD